MSRRRTGKYGQHRGQSKSGGAPTTGRGSVSLSAIAPCQPELLPVKIAPVEATDGVIVPMHILTAVSPWRVILRCSGKNVILQFVHPTTGVPADTFHLRMRHAISKVSTPARAYTMHVLPCNMRESLTVPLSPPRAQP